MARNICIQVAYDGTEFHGWQTQPGLRTAQGLLEQAIRRVARHQIDLTGSGRTDAGVHAAGQVANFWTSCPIPHDRLKSAIGSRLPKDLCVLRVAEVSAAFHAIRSASSKLYRYRIHNAAHRPVCQLTQRQTYHFWHELDPTRMRVAARYFVGCIGGTCSAGNTLAWDNLAITCTEDITEDLDIGFADLLEILAQWGTADPLADLDNDQDVGFSDLLQLLAKWGKCS